MNRATLAAAPWAADPLAALPTHLLDHVTGDRRRRLVEYLLRWDAGAAALACLDHWLAAQPQLVTLREARARVLVELGHAEQGLAAVAAIDAERGPTETRRGLRLRALLSLADWEAALALLPDCPDDPASWRARADLWRRQGRYAEAAEDYARAAALLPEDTAPLRGLAELALDRGDPASARLVLEQRLAHDPAAPPDPRDLRLLHTALTALGDASALQAVERRLWACHADEQAALCGVIGFDLAELSNHLPAPAPTSVPPPAEPPLDDAVLAALHQHFGFRSFRPGQADVIARVLRGESVLAVLPTGAGKSLTYQLPALLLPGATLVLSPLIALMKDQVENLPPALAERATALHSGLEGGELAVRLRGVAEGRYRLIYVAPERLRQQSFVHALRRAGLARVVVDEAHCVSLWGISFRPDYLFIRRALDELGAPPVLALTATATPETEAEIKDHLGALTTVRTSIFRPNLRFEVRQVANKHEKFREVVALCREVAGPLVVYVRSREGCEELAAYLRDHEIAAEHYHAQVGNRDRVQNRFMAGDTRVLVATVAFGMGVDKADVRAIIHYNLPQSIEAYYQEAGRAGRDGLPARCVLLYAPADKGQLTGWLREDSLGKDDLRRVYGWLRKAVSRGWGIVSFEDLRRDLRQADETKLRVALGMLERVELLARHFDLPRSATLTLRDQLHDDPALAELTAAADLYPELPCEVDLVGLAAQLGLTPDRLERQLLGWRDAGLLRYDGAARDVLLELRPPAADIGARIDELLAEYARRQDARVDAIGVYARRPACRHRVIAAHFGEQLAPCRAACDVCQADDRRPARELRTDDQPTPAAAVSARVREAALAAVAELPGQLSDKDLAGVLLGLPGFPLCAAHGQLAGMDFGAARQAIGVLVASGLLAYHHKVLVPAVRTARPATPAQLDQLIVGCLDRLPFGVGRSGLAKILKGAAGSPIGPERCADFAALGHMTVKDIEAAIMDLVARGYLLRQDGIRPLLALSEQGRALVEGQGL